jgi:signal transduction histidine kinase
MLLFARQGRFEMEDLTVAALVQGLRDQLGPRLEARGVCLECRVDAPDAGLRGSPQALAGALGNLVDNACEAGARRVRLTALRVGADRLAMDVADDGPGVPPGLRERLFRPFFTTRSGGSGLGLAVARAVAEAHGGTVGLVDDSGGARFRVELPLWPQARCDGRTAAVREGA